ncbi:MAG: hypothetical protein GEV07_12820 [Streptosporangiales bacterium]|nr:hypothetical protein [Streptosporangiales bacterium]
MSATPSFDDLEAPDPAGDGDPQPQDYGDPVEFAGPPVPAIDDGSTDYPQPTVDSWSDADAHWQPSFTSGDQYTIQPTMAQPPGYPPQQYPPPPYGVPPPGMTHYGQPPPPPQHGGGRRRVVYAALIALAVLLAGTLAVGSVLALGGGDEDDTADAKDSSPVATSKKQGEGSAAPTTGAKTATEQAEAVDALLSKAADGKHLLTIAYDQANNCEITPAQAEKRFEAAADNRRSIVRKARKLDTSRLDNGPRIKSQMIAMYSTSAKADDAFAAWARAGANSGTSCLSETTKRTKGNSLSIRAGKQKQQFVRVWNPVAKQFGHSKRSKSGL